MVDGSVSNIGVKIKEIEKGIRVLRVVLQRCKVPDSTVIIEYDATLKLRHPVYAVRLLDSDDQ